MHSKTLVGAGIALLVSNSIASQQAAAAPPANSPYMTDPQQSYVQDATSESIGQVNMIACVMHSMRPDALVNAGPYIALIDQNKCDSAKSSAATSGAGATGAQAPKYMTAVVNSTRASNKDPMLVSAWISIDQDGTPATVYAHIAATEAPSDANPYGAFRLDYCGKATGGSGCLMNGFMQGGSGQLSYYEADQGGGNGGSQVTALQLSSVGTSTGSGRVSVLQSSGGQSRNTTFDFAYDQSYFLRGDGQTAAECFSRDAGDPQTGFAVWQYGLYDATTGQRFDRNSGFPISYTVSGTRYDGYAGYFGLSMQSGAPLPASGSTVQKVSYDGGTSASANYTVVTHAGRLTRYTRQTRSLASIDQLPVNVFIGSATGLGLPTDNTQYVLHWDEHTQGFIATGFMSCGSGGCNTSSLSPVVTVAPTAFTNQGGLQGWSQSLGGDVFVDLSHASGGLNSASTTVVYHVQDLVYPDDPNVPATLYCISNCPTAASLQAYFGASGTAPASPFAGTSFNQWQPVAANALVQYGVSGAVLSDGGGPVVDTAANYAASPQYQSGVMSGRLFANMSDALCSGQGSPAQYCDYKVNDADVYYVWQTGSNSWNQFAALKDASNQFVHFDPPLNVGFAVPAGSQYGNYAGSSLVLQYNGFGDLWGIPGSCVSQFTNAPEDCSAADARYVPDFVIPYDPGAASQQGVVTGTVGGSSRSFLVKWLQREIRLARKDASVCTAAHLALPQNVSLPGATQLQDPSSPSSSVYLGPQPTVNAAPRVIHGVVEY